MVRRYFNLVFILPVFPVHINCTLNNLFFFLAWLVSVVYQNVHGHGCCCNATGVFLGDG